MIVRFFLFSIEDPADYRFVDQHIQDGQNMYAQSKAELDKLSVGGNSGVEETNEAVMDDETGHRKRGYSSDDSDRSDLSRNMMKNVFSSN